MNNELLKALQDAARKSELTEEQIAKKANMNQSTVHRILTGKSRDPRPSNLAKMAKALGLKTLESPLLGDSVSAVSAVQGQVPLISWVQAGEWSEAVDNHQPGDAEMWLPCPAAHSESSYALRVRGASMEPRFHEGEILIVDPQQEALPGKFVVAKNGAGEVTFKQLKAEGHEPYLYALNPDWPERIIKVDGEWQVIGVVICKVDFL